MARDASDAVDAVEAEWAELICNPSDMAYAEPLVRRWPVARSRQAQATSLRDFLSRNWRTGVRVSPVAPIGNGQQRPVRRAVDDFLSRPSRPSPPLRSV